MKIGPILKSQQPDIHSQLKKNNSNERQNKSKGNGEKGESHSFSFYENLMKQDSFSRGKGRAIKQKGWGG